MLTIITATYNAAATLPRLLESLAAQTCQDFELVIQDGASSDDTVAVAESYRHRLPSLSLVSEPDAGIYDAWNKALPRVRGEWVLFLGADDTLADKNVLCEVRDNLLVLPKSVVFACGVVLVVHADGSIDRRIEPDKANALSLLRQGIMPLGHTALFQRTEVLRSYAFDPAFKIAGDYDFFCATLQSEARLSCLPLVVTHMGSGGLSDSPFSTPRIRREILRSMRRHFPEVVRFKKHYLPVIKGWLLECIFVLLGQRHSLSFWNAVRSLRGLPPVWKKQDENSPRQHP